MRDLSFRTSKEKQKYFMTLSILIFLSLVSIYGLLKYNNPVAVDSPSFLPVIRRRQNAIIAMLIAATCHAFSTLLFQTITNNRIITPSLLGFEAVYSTINTATMYFLGINSFIAISGMTFYLSQIAIMILISLILFSTLLRKDRGVDFLLLVGIIMGQGLRSVSAFMRRLLSPSEFDILQAKLFASVNNSDSSYFLISAILVLLVVGIIFSKSSKLNVIGLGSSASTNLGIDYKKSVIYSLIGISILMSISTALIGPMNFFGFIIVSLTYEFANTYDHKYLFMMTLFLAFFILTTSYFIMNHIFNANGVVSILIELVGGLYFIYIVFRKGKR
ncbi:iron chelate uptake ABC transporter family permease subunit [uncultured Helcococcus sp.]|uniref:iron chelate uptake ABC transporter family permease subunit n=1 Tax=uncultured Helcococcus sp. TaxID=1072508 RepID=UPI00262935E5|nr:iron chelate uptake ABC transporter family permease subunit [uncultured Helcococcus sp.]